MYLAWICLDEGFRGSVLGFGGIHPTTSANVEGEPSTTLAKTKRDTRPELAEELSDR
jgi:hypothetical protein